MIAEFIDELTMGKEKEKAVASDLKKTQSDDQDEDDENGKKGDGDGEGGTERDKDKDDGNSRKDDGDGEREVASELKLVEKKELLKSFYKLLDQGKVPSKAQVTSRAKVNVILKDVNIELALEYLKKEDFNRPVS